MTSYIARSGGEKKKNILRQMELALRGGIRRDLAIDKLHRSAEQVRSAQLGVIKALFVEATPAREEDQEKARGVLQKLQEGRDHWERISVEEIVQIYSKDTDEVSFVGRKKWWDSRPR